MKRFAIAAVAAFALVVGASQAVASTIVDDFTFYSGPGDTGTKLATGSFSYNSSLSGMLSYADLSSFTITVLGKSYNLAFVDSLSPSDYVNFGYDTVSNSFVPTLVNGFEGAFGGLLAGTDTNTGFFIDPLVGSPNPPGNADGEVEEYSTQLTATAASISISPVPEPAAWAMMLAGFFGLGAALRMCRRQNAFVAA